MTDSWDDYADDWDSNAAARSYADLAYRSLIKHVDPTSCKRILDFGCGTGLLTERLVNNVSLITGLDTSAKMIGEFERKKLHGVATECNEMTSEWVAGTIARQGKFDLIVASSVCAFLPNFESFLTNAKRALMPGGLFVQWDWHAADSTSTSGFCRDSLAAAYTKAGFVIKLIELAFELDTEHGQRAVIMGIAVNP